MHMPLERAENRDVNKYLVYKFSKYGHPILSDKYNIYV